MKRAFFHRARRGSLLGPAVALLLAASGAAAQVGGVAPATETGAPPARTAEDLVEFRVTVPAPSARALEYRLAFSPVEQLEGNAASQWLQACLLHGKDESRSEVVSGWISARDDAFDQDAAWASIAGFVHDVYPVVLVAARKDHCDWGSPIRSEGIATMLPELSALRDVARSIALKARIEIVNKDFAAAAETIGIGFKLASDLGDSQTLIQGLVGAAIASLMCAQVEDWIRAEQSPSLYWPLSHLPTPLVSLTRAYSYESSMLDFTFPDLERLKNGSLSPQEASRLSAEIMSNLGSMGGGAARESNEAQQFAAVTVAYPTARAHLIGGGMTEAEVDALPVSYVTLRWQIETYRKYSDEVFKWAALPFAEIEPVMERVWPAMADEMVDAQSQQPMLMILPAITNSFVSSVRVERTFALLRVTEALRLHAGEHGALPASLSDITTLPIPNDPVTGAPFVYRVENGTAIITGRPPKMGPNHMSVERRISLSSNAPAAPSKE